MKRGEPARHPQKRAAIEAAIIAALVFIAYAPAIGAGWIWDDNRYLTDNPAVKSPDGIARIWLRPMESTSPYPLIFTSFWIEWRLWGADPRGYHSVNIALHAANAIILVWLLRRLRAPGAFLAGLVFALHPVQAETVAWVAERKNLLSTLFALLSSIAWLSFLDGGRRRDFGLSLAAFVAALLSKTAVAPLPLLLLGAAWLRPRETFRKSAPWLAPHFALALAFGLATAWWERNRTGATDAAIDLGFVERALIASRAPWFYLQKLMWPASLASIYPRWETGAGRALAWLFPAGLAGASMAVLALGGARRRAIAIAAACFLAMIGPVLGFIDYSTMTKSFAADHYQYLACAAWIALASAAAAIFAGKLPQRAAWLGVWGAGAALLVLGAFTARQAALHRTQAALFLDNARKNPASEVVADLAGYGLLSEGRIEEARAQFERALRINPRYAPSMNNLASAMARGGNPEDSRRLLEAALAITPESPAALTDMGQALLKQGDVAGAEANYLAAIKVAPEFAYAHFNLGLLRQAQGRLPEAEALFAEARRLKPELAEASLALATLALHQGKSAEAESLIAEAMRLAPDNVDALSMMAIVRAQQGRAAEAIELLQKATSRNPEVAEAQLNLGVLLAQTGRAQEAAPRLRKAVALKPGLRDSIRQAGLEPLLGP